VLPYRRDLLDALDGVPADLKGLSTMRGCGGDDDTGLADLEAADAMVYRDRGVGPRLARFGLDSLEHALGQRVEGLVHEERHPTAVMRGADHAHERRHRAAPIVGRTPSALDRAHERLDR
jgi:hypothetical protein